MRGNLFKIPYPLFINKRDFMIKTFRFAVGCFLALNLMSCGGGGGSSNSSSGSTCSAGSSANTGSTAVTSLTYVDNVVGTGAAVADGQTLTVNYSGWLYNSSDANNEGTQFAAQANDGSPFSFVLGAGEVIAGWDQGLVGMKVGGTRTLTIPSSLGYGSCPVAGSPIPPNSALVFTVQLVSAS
jgi:FKBP-type peptidyl-prolyl cis-trans isomerase FkpA